jgi:aminoglycoside phosphotransferase (APT) family kinase protein
LNEPLEPEIAIALERAGLRARSVRALSRIRPAASGRAVYRIDLEAGRTIKARRLNDEATARRLFEIRAELPTAFAPAFCQHGRVLLEEWIEGEELGDACPDAAQLAEAGALLAQLHARTTLAGEALHAWRSTRSWREQTEQGLASLVAAAALEARAGRGIGAALARLDPQRALVGLVHSDFCGENLLIDGSGRLRVIDNERLRVDALGFDLARSWYRWALPPPAWERFESAYAAALPFSEPLGNLAFWSLVAVVKSAVLRLRIDPERAHVPLTRLRAMACARDERRAQG